MPEALRRVLDMLIRRIAGVRPAYAPARVQPRRWSVARRAPVSWLDYVGRVLAPWQVRPPRHTRRFTCAFFGRLYTASNLRQHNPGSASPVARPNGEVWLEEGTFW